MDETYALVTVSGIRFYYRIRSDLVSGVPMVTLSYGSLHSPSQEHDIQFNEEIKTFPHPEAGDQYTSELRRYITNLGYKPI